MAASNPYDEEVNSTDSNPGLNDCFTFIFYNANGDPEAIEWSVHTDNDNPNNTETRYDVSGQNLTSSASWTLGHQTAASLEWQYEEGCQRLYSVLTERAPRPPKKSEFGIPERTADGRRSPSAGTIMVVWWTREGDGERPTECALQISRYDGIETFQKMPLAQIRIA
ncbi:hypothetical protein B9479_004305 [Cryptococcus floricola]|uniref:Uncharacterized protein n=1 Tax=Cryptococcus floricola TaxID=2591691 RepID=A0A5D3AWW1_9TREE|nr:hypothetical protein B9479_004305 [Cryptococcus floricola]